MEENQFGESFGTEDTQGQIQVRDWWAWAI